MRETADFHDSLIRERRYALLQAAAVIYACAQHEVTPVLEEPASYYMSNWQTPESAVTEAEYLLAEVEKREAKDKS